MNSCPILNRLAGFGCILILICVNTVFSFLGTHEVFPVTISVSLVFGAVLLVHSIMSLLPGRMNQSTHATFITRILLIVFIILMIAIFCVFRFPNLGTDEEYQELFRQFVNFLLPLLILFTLYSSRNGCTNGTLFSFSTIFPRNFALPVMVSSIVWAWIHFHLDEFRDVAAMGAVLLHTAIAGPFWIIFSAIALTQYIMLATDFRTERGPASSPKELTSTGLLYVFGVAQNFLTPIVLIVSSLLCAGYANVVMVTALTDPDLPTAKTNLIFAMIASGAAAVTHAYFLTQEPQSGIRALWARWHWAFLVPPLLSVFWLTLAVEGFSIPAAQVLMLLISLAACMGSLLNIRRNLVGLLNAYLFLALLCHAAFA